MKLHSSSRGRDLGSFRPSRPGCGHGIILAVLLVSALALWLLLGRPDATPAASASATAKAQADKRLTLRRYLRLGGLRADARTLVAAGRWLLEPDAQPVPARTNASAIPSVPNTNPPSGRAPS